MSKIKKNQLISELMTKNPDVLSKGAKVSEAAAIMREKRHHHIPIVSGKKLVGMFTFTDLMRIDYSSALNQDSREVMADIDSRHNIADFMTEQLVKIKEKDTIFEAAKALSSGNFHSLPVVDADDNLIGLITSSDVIRFLADLR